jgi:8-oxo-dGTP pyrophosphatase MutT (NUDIX family)
MPVEPRLAATVLLLRDSPRPRAGGATLEVWLMERSRAVGFMARAWVFPGGRVDPADAETPFEAPFACGPAAAWIGAVREVREEAGVRLDPSRLRPWSRWITPEIEPRRYDTWFYAAALPEGQEAVADGGEAAQGAWFAPEDAVARIEAGTLPVAPPTLRTLGELVEHRTVAEALARPIHTPPICPRFWKDEAAGALWVLLPGDPGHPVDDPGSAVRGPTRFPFDAGRWWEKAP